MPDTVRTRTDLLDLLADNFGGLISPQDIRDALVSVMPTGRTATTVVAASDAPLLAQIHADVVCTGTNDDQTIVTELDNLALTGGAVVLTVGNYACGAAIVNNSENVTLTGQGRGTRLNSTLLTGPVVRNNADGFTVSDIAVGHVNPLVRNSGAIGVYGVGCEGMVVRNVEVYASAAAGILLQTVTHAEVTSCLVHDVLADGIHVTGASDTVRVENCDVWDTGDDALASVGYQSGGVPNKKITFVGCTVARSKANGARIEGTDLGVVLGCTFDETKSGGIVVTYSAAFATFGCDGVTVQGNHVKGANTYDSPSTVQPGIDVRSASDAFPVLNVTVQGNHIYGGGQDFISINDGAGNTANAVRTVSVIDNHLYGPNLSGSGIVAADCTDITIRGNMVYDAYLHSVSVAASVEGTVLITQNQIHETNQSAGTGYGVDCQGGDEVIISLNIVRDRDGDMTAAYNDGSFPAGTIFTNNLPAPA